jgi:hypothetical protein
MLLNMENVNDETVKIPSAFVANSDEDNAGFLQ